MDKECRMDENPDNHLYDHGCSEVSISEKTLIFIEVS